MTSQQVELSQMNEGNLSLDGSQDSPVLEVNCVVKGVDDKSDTANQSSTHTVQTKEDQTDPEQSEENVKNGINNPVFMEDEGNIEETQPCLTYIDFLPQQAHPDITSVPIYSDFSSIVEQANSWLKQNPEYSLWKCETVVFKLQNDFSVEQDNPFYMESAYGMNRFIHGLRLWLVPQLNTSLPVAQIGFTTALPGRQADNQEVRVSTNNTIQDSIEQLNKQFLKKPLPGVLLTIEIIEFNENETSGSLSIDPNRTYWTENGSENTVMVQAVRIFFIIGKSEHVKIGYHDELPEIKHVSFATSFRLGPYRDVVFKMGAWLKRQKGIRIINLQTLNAVVTIGREGSISVNTSRTSHIERTGVETRYAKYLRAFYVTRKSEETPYESVNLHTRIFTPIKKEGRVFESFSKTMQRTIKWLDYTRLPPFAVETVRYNINVSGDVVHSLEDKADKTIRRGAGRFQLSNIRIYFPSEYTEPPPEISPEVDTAAGWGCVIS